MRAGRSPRSLLLPIAEQLAKFVCEEDFANVKACRGHNGTLMFADPRAGKKMVQHDDLRQSQAAHRKRIKDKR